MSGKRLLNALGQVDEKYIEESAPTARGRKKRGFVKWAAMAACFCVVITGAVYALTSGDTSGSEDKPILEWSENFKAASYFKYNGKADGASSSSSLDSGAIPYAYARYFSDNREKMETDGVIPEMEDYPLFDCVAHYNEDGRIYSVTFTWGQREDVYSNLSITAGIQAVERIEDTIAIEVDENGNIVETAVTVTERDGIQIVAEGNENRTKTLTFQNDTGWYQVTGSWNDSYESVVELLDWVWENPVDFDLFDMSLGVEYTYLNLDDYPDALADYIPDFEDLGYVLGENNVVLKDGKPISFEGHYYTGGDESAVTDGYYSSKDGWIEIHWYVTAEADYYDLQKSLGDISQLKEQLIADTLSEGSSFAFTIGDFFIQVYTEKAQAHDAWMAVESLVNQG
jgi:hypothetical protein